MASEMQHTLAREFTLHGVGLHTGCEAGITVAPAPLDAGFSFVLEDGSRIAATPEAVRSTVRCTTLASPSSAVNTVEHVLAALVGMDVDNALISMSGIEVPIADGSALPFARAIADAGVVEQAAPRRILEVREPMLQRDGDKLLVMVPAPAFSIDFFVSFPEPVGGQFLTTPAITPDYFLREIAPARTFAFRTEVDALMAQGLARGGSLDNAVVVDSDGYMGELRFPDEIVRHKVLDLIGDLALIGMHPRCRVIALRTGHAMHVAAARALRAHLAAATG
jgi:UDP-3-O-acyl N-acetylglucosamine deacetylase